MAYGQVYKLEPDNGEIVEKLGSVYFNDKNPHQDPDKAFTFFKDAIKKLKSEIGKQNLAMRMYEHCVATNTEDKMKKFKSYLPENTTFKDDTEEEHSWQGSDSSEDDME
jgi:hypothetical protein